MEFEKVTKEHILEAIKDFEERGIPKGFGPSSTYNLEFEGKTYPPKSIMAYANFRATGRKIEPYFKGGLGTDCFKAFERNGFKIIKKMDTTKADFTWVDTHKKIVEYLNTKENSQLELINLLKSVGIGPFNDKSEDDNDIELTEIDPFTFFCYIYKYGPKRRLKYLQEIAKTLKITLPHGDSGIPSSQAQKVWMFPYKSSRKNNEIQRLWSLFKKELDDQLTNEDFEDALQIQSTGKTKLTETLFYINPEKYLPINGPTKPYIKEKLGIEPKFKTYSEYKEILAKIRQNSDLPFYELSYKAWEWNNSRKKINYWLFQGNPKVFDFESALKNEILTDWTVSAHKDKINIGDKVILWITGKQPGCYAFAEIVSKPHEKKSSPDDHLWKVEDKSTIKVDIKITNNLVSEPILKSSIESIEDLKGLKAGNQGTNFSATEEEFEILKSLVKNKSNSKMNYWLYAPGEGAKHWDDFYDSGEMGLGWAELGNLRQYQTKEEIAKALQAQPDSKGSRKNDATANWDFANEIKVGDVVIAKRGRSEFLGYGIVTSDYYFDEEKKSYESRRKMDWKAKGSWKRTDGKTLVLKTLTNITQYTEYVKMIKGLMGINDEKPKEQVKLDLPKNLILYGPPGTGKTHKLTNEYFELFTERKQVVSLEDKQKELAERHSWWEVITICMLDLKKGKVQDVLNHPLLQAKSAISETKNLRATIWSLLQTFTKKDCPNVNLTKRRDPEIFWKDDNSVWSVDVEVLKEQLPEIHEDFEWMNYAEEEENLKQRFKTVTFHQSYSYEDFIEGIKPVLETEGADNSDIGYQIEAGIFKKICLEAKNDPNQPYAIFIDEINRGNVASVFGELITLIEADKRTGEKNEISLELPYSKKSFSVPSNLHIIGTMNTADRSVEALDTALRRRFSFVEMIPEPVKIESDGASKGKIDDIDLVKLLSTINERIEVLVDRDHTIGHAFFMNARSLSDLKAVIGDKIIPLLQEYFYGDYHKMELVLGNGFFEKKAVEKVKFAVTTDLQFEGEMFTILDAKEMNDNDFKAAIEGIGFNAE